MISLEVKDSLFGKQCRAVSYRRFGKGIKIKSCSNVNEQGMKRLISANTCAITLAAPAMVIESFSIPAQTSEKSKSVLFKSKLSKLDKEKDKDSNSKYSVIYFKDENNSTNIKASYTVYGVSDKLFDSSLNLSERAKENITFYTVDLFGLVAISQRVEPENYVLHIFADENVLHIIFSTGGTLVYSRTVDMPDMEGEQSLMDDFYYENINITYLYVRQNFANVKMSVILTGKLHGNEKIAAQVAEFIGLEVTVPEAKQIARGVSDEDLHEFLIPIGVALLDKRYDFSSEQERTERLIRKFFLSVNAALVPAVVVMAFMFMQSADIFSAKSREMQTRARNLFNSETALLNDIGDQNILRYKSSFVDIIRSKNDMAISMLKPLEDLLQFQKFSNVTFEGSGATAKASVSLDEPQIYYVSIEDLSRKMTERLNLVRDRSLNVNDNSLHTLKDLTNKIKIVMTPTGVAK